MRRLLSSTAGRIALAVALAVLIVVSVAAAFFASSGAATASASAGTLSQPTLTATPESPGAGEVALHWTAATVPSGSPAVAYYVTRAGGTVGGDCPSSTATAITSLTCTDQGVAAGTYSYTVTAVWKSWTSTSAQASATLAYGPLAQFQLSGASTATAGVGFDVTITAQDANGNTVADYTGNHSLTFSGAAIAPNGTYPTVTDAKGTAQNFGTAEAVSFSGGVASDGATSDVMTLYKSETADVTVTDGTASSNALPVTVSATSASQLVFLSAPVSEAASASASLGPITVEEKDQFGNPTTTAETLSLSSSSKGTTIFNTSQGATTTGTVSIPAGASSVSFYYGDTHADGPTITAAATGLTSATQTETITPAAASQLVFLTAPVSGTASASASVGPITVQEQDQFGNPTTTAETVSLSSSSSPASNYIFNTTQNATSPTGPTTVSILAGSSSVSFYYGDSNAGAPTITASAGALTNATQTETITPPVAITSVSNDNGNVKISGTGTGTANGAITVTICATSTFPCASPAGTATATVGSNGLWTSGQDTNNLTAGQQYWAQAVQTNPSGTSPVFGPFVPEAKGTGNPTTTISTPLSTICYYNTVSAHCSGTSKSWSAEGGQISGTAASAAGGALLASVQVAIENPNGMWWNGSTFASAVPIYIVVASNVDALTTAWSYPITAAQLGSTTGAFTVEATATDADDMTSPLPTTPFTFTWNN